MTDQDGYVYSARKDRMRDRSNVKSASFAAHCKTKDGAMKVQHGGRDMKDVRGNKEGKW